MNKISRLLICGILSCLSIQILPSQDLNEDAFNEAVEKRDLDLMASLLYLDTKIPYILKGESFENAYRLLWAYKDDNRSEVGRLLNLKVSPNALDENYHTILHLACIKNDTEMVERLLSEELLTLFSITYSHFIVDDPPYKNVVIRKCALNQSVPVLLGTGELSKTAFFCACELDLLDVLEVFLEYLKKTYGRYYCLKAKDLFSNKKFIDNRESFSEEVKIFLTEKFEL